MFDVFHDRACVFLKSSLYIAREVPSYKCEASPWLPAPCSGEGRDSFTCLFPQWSLLSHPPLTRPLVPVQVWGWGGWGRQHSPGAVTGSSGGLRERGMYTKPPLPLLGISWVLVRHPPSQVIAGLSHLSLFPGMAVAPICAQSLGITGNTKSIPVAPTCSIGNGSILCPYKRGLFCRLSEWQERKPFRFPRQKS